MKKNPVLSLLLVAAVLAPAPLLAAAKPVAKPEAKAEGKAKGLAKYDANHNRVIDAEEYAAVREAFEKDPKGELAKMDTDHDGKLSDTELAALGGGKKGAKSDAEREEKRMKKTDRKKPAKD